MELSVKGICKSFGGGPVLDGVDLTVRGGEICALLGENGAGKSTLMNIIGGNLSADKGEIFLDGRTVSFASPSASQKAGIAFIHQELNLINDLTVYENLFLPDLLKKGPFIDRKSMIAEARALFERLNIPIDPCAEVGTLDISYKQMIEITKALRAEAKLIIMDEPTASLTGAEIERVFSIMRTLKEKGIGMIFISHKLGEVMTVCDRYSVLRNGRVVSDGRIEDADERLLAAFMVGHEVKMDASHCAGAYGGEVLRFERLTDQKHFYDVSLTLRKGEILGITGLLGDGRSELCSTVFGSHEGHFQGSIYLEGRKIRPSSPHDALKKGIAYLQKNRKENSIIPDLSILDNATVTTLNRYLCLGLLNKKRQCAAFFDEADKLNIRYSDPENPITTLSGGNQQKAVLAKWLIADPKVLILDNPTQGVDVGAKEEIYSIIETLAKQGLGIIVLSSEAQEIIRVCDRSLVMYHGHVVGVVEGKDMNEPNMMYLATGAGKDQT